MSKKLYVIRGIPYTMTENTKEFRQDLKLFRETENEVYARIALTPFQALMARIQIIQYNLTHPCYMEIWRMKGKRFRA